MLKGYVTAWGIVTDDERLVPFDFPVEGTTVLAGIFIDKEDADRWLKKIVAQTGFKGSVEKVIIQGCKKGE